MTADIQAKLDAILGVLQPMVDAANAIPALVDAAEQAQFDAGKASVVLPSPEDPTVQFTQADMDKLAATAKQEQSDADAAALKVVSDASVAKDSQIADLQSQVSAAAQAPAANGQFTQDQVQAQIDAAVAPLNSALAAKDQEKADAVAAVRSDLTAKVQAWEGNEDQSVKDLLASF